MISTTTIPSTQDLYTKRQNREADRLRKWEKSHAPDVRLELETQLQKSFTGIIHTRHKVFQNNPGQVRRLNTRKECSVLRAEEGGLSTILTVSARAVTWNSLGSRPWPRWIRCAWPSTLHWPPVGRARCQRREPDAPAPITRATEPPRGFPR